MLRDRLKRLLCFVSMLSLLCSNFYLPISAAECNFDGVKTFEYPTTSGSTTIVDIRYKNKVEFENFKDYASRCNPNINWANVTNYAIGNVQSYYESSTNSVKYTMTEGKEVTLDSSNCFTFDFSDITFLGSTSFIKMYYPYNSSSGVFEVLDDGHTLAWNIGTYAYSSAIETNISLSEANFKGGYGLSNYDFSSNPNISLKHCSTIYPESTVINNNEGLMFYSCYNPNSYYYSSEPFRYRYYDIVIKDEDGNDVTSSYYYMITPSADRSDSSYAYGIVLILSDGSSTSDSSKFRLDSVATEPFTPPDDGNTYAYPHIKAKFTFTVGDVEHRHIFSDSPSFSWANDYSSCTADFECYCGYIMKVPCSVVVQETLGSCCVNHTKSIEATCPIEYEGYNLAQPNSGNVPYKNSKYEDFGKDPHIYTVFEEVEDWDDDNLYIGADNRQELVDAGYLYYQNYLLKFQRYAVLGKKVYIIKCTNFDNCGYYRIKVSPATDCEPIDTSTVTNPTCTEDGFGDYYIKCATCNYVYLDEDVTLPKLGHDLQDDWTHYQDATLNKPKQNIRYCHRDNCNYSETEDLGCACASIKGTLKDVDGNPIADKEVSFISNSRSVGLNTSVTTDSSGNFEVTDIDLSNNATLTTQLQFSTARLSETSWAIPLKLSSEDDDDNPEFTYSEPSNLAYTCTPNVDLTNYIFSLDISETPIYNLKVVDKYGDTETERSSEDKFKGFEYSFSAIETNDYEVDGETTKSGTLDGDTTITFNYKLKDTVSPGGPGESEPKPKDPKPKEPKSKEPDKPKPEEPITTTSEVNREVPEEPKTGDDSISLLYLVYILPLLVCLTIRLRKNK